jgi:hypothetical protein
VAGIDKDLLENIIVKLATSNEFISWPRTMRSEGGTQNCERLEEVSATQFAAQY